MSHLSLVPQVEEGVKRSGPVHRLGSKLSDIQAGLKSVQNRLEDRSPTVAEAKLTQKVGVLLKGMVQTSCIALLVQDLSVQVCSSSVLVQLVRTSLSSDSSLSSERMGRPGCVALSTGSSGGRNAGLGETR